MSPKLRKAEQSRRIGRRIKAEDPVVREKTCRHWRVGLCPDCEREYWRDEK